MEDKKLKVLISAYACEPDKGSEPGVGWNWVKQIARIAEVWVITRENNKESIEKETKKRPVPSLHFVYVDLPKAISFWKRGQKGVRTYYYLWQFAALKEAFKLSRTVTFDISHHITFVNDWLPSFLAILPIPFVWGPIGSHPPSHLEFLPNHKAKILETLRRLVQSTFRHIDPLFYLTLIKAKYIISISKQIHKKYPYRKLSISRFLYQAANGINLLDQPKIHRENSTGNIKIISVGRLIYFKGFYLALAALAEASKKKNCMEFIIAGDGMERETLQYITHKFGIEEDVVFLGNIPRWAVLENLAKSDIFLFPSFEGGGMVVLEAMAAGLPVVCLDYGGPGEMVTEECGIKVKPVFPEQTIKELSEALLKLAINPDLRRRMGEAGRKRVDQYYTWDKKGEFIKKIYQSVLGNESSINS